MMELIPFTAVDTTGILRIPTGESVVLPEDDGWKQWDLAVRLQDVKEQ